MLRARGTVRPACLRPRTVHTPCERRSVGCTCLDRALSFQGCGACQNLKQSVNHGSELKEVQ